MLDTRTKTFHRLWSYSTGFYGAWLVHIGRATGLLDHIASKPRSARELARSGRLYLPAVEAWCSASLAYGIIGKSTAGRFTLPASTESLLLDKTNPDYLGGQFSYLALRSLEYSAMRELFQHGRTRPIKANFDAVEEATHWDHYSFLKAISRDRRLHQQLRKGCTLADIGCGTGSLLAKLCEKYPKSRYVGIDPSKEAVALAKKRLAGKTTSIIRMKAEKLPHIEKFDIIYLGESLYASSDKKSFLANCYRSLVRGGTIIILEGLLPERKVRRNDLLIMGMQIDFAFQGLRFLTKKELRKLLRSAKFTNICFRYLGGSVYLTSATKSLLGTEKSQ